MLKNSACLSATVLPPHPASLWLKDFYINSFGNHKKKSTIIPHRRLLNLHVSEDVTPSTSGTLLVPVSS